MGRVAIGFVALGLGVFGCSSSGDDASPAGGGGTGGLATGGGPSGGLANGGTGGSTGGLPSGGGASGGDASGGATPGGAGAEATGGAAASGGTTTGGAATGGTTTGGAATGGTTTGGVATGGAATGGTTTGGAATGGTTTGGAPPTGICGAAEGQLFGSSFPWNQRADTMALDAESALIIDYLATYHTEWGRFRLDGPSDEPDNLYGITVLYANASTPHQTFTPTRDFWSPDCDPAAPPIPAGGAIEGESAFACTEGGDCHLIVIDTAECRLFEMWKANRQSASAFSGGCNAVWNLDATYEPTLRGDCCTSADAAGLPIAAHMFTADEVAAGVIRHALRFILPNHHMRERIYVRPATHSTEATSGPAAAPPYGARLRLRSDFDDAGLNDAAKVVARALQEYGMILSDGGDITFTAANDRFTTAKWADVGLGPTDLEDLEWTDFEVVSLGTRYVWDESCSCDRTPITE